MKERIISAIIMVVIFVPLLILGDVPFAIFMALLADFGFYELVKAKETKKKLPLVLKIFSYVMIFIFSMYKYGSIDFQYEFDYRVMAVMIFLFLSPMVIIRDSSKYSLNDALFLIGAIIFIGMSFNLLIMIRNYDIMYIIYLLIITTITDSFALFTGSLIGKHKLCPSISPNKTIEGLVGGVLMGTFVATAFYFTVISSSISLVLLIFVTCGLCLVGQLGDLVFSSIKRYYEVKDFSNIIPGHGGILDRFDSLIFVTFAFIIFKGIL